MHKTEIFRYVVNGVIATLVHFLVLSFNIEVLGFQSAGVANFVAALIAISASFLGSRYYVFQKHGDPILGQATVFVILYGCIALVNGLVLLVWTDIYGYDYRIGFVVSTCLQVAMSYTGNKYLVFRR
jgi:putative flippase GtrA